MNTVEIDNELAALRAAFDDVDKALVAAVFEVVVEASRRRQQPATPAIVVRTR